MEYVEVIRQMRMMGDPRSIEGMSKAGINTDKALGIPIPKLRGFAKRLGPNHALAQKLWSSGIHEGDILAGMVDEPDLVTDEQMDKWVRGIDSWDVCDQTCQNLFEKTKFADKKAMDWAKRDQEFVKRAGFVLMARFATNRTDLTDADFEKYFPLIKDAASDDRNFVKKAVNWAIRQIGKRNAVLNKKAISLCQEIEKMDSLPAKWIASNALFELKSEAVQKRFKNPK